MAVEEGVENEIPVAAAAAAAAAPESSPEVPCLDCGQLFESLSKLNVLLLGENFCNFNASEVEILLEARQPQTCAKPSASHSTVSPDTITTSIKTNITTHPKTTVQVDRQTQNHRRRRHHHPAPLKRQLSMQPSIGSSRASAMGARRKNHRRRSHHHYAPPLRRASAKDVQSGSPNHRRHRHH